MNDAAAERKARAKRAAKNKAALRRGASKAAARVASGDMGADLALARDTVEVVDTLVPDDPDDKRSPLKQKRRAQVVWAPDRLSKGRAPAIEAHQLQAAEKYLNDFLVGVEGASYRPNIVVAHTDPHFRNHPGDHRLDALRSFRLAERQAGPRFGSILAFCVLMRTPGPTVAPTVANWASINGWRSVERAVEHLAGALELLAVYYSLVDKRGRAEAHRRDSEAKSHA